MRASNSRDAATSTTRSNAVGSPRSSTPSTHSEVMKLRTIFAAFATSALMLGAPDARADKIRDVCDVVGARDNQLVGYGVVIGLNGTGDDVSAPFAAQSLRALLRRLGVQIDQKQVRLKNVAAVVV